MKKTIPPLSFRTCKRVKKQLTRQSEAAGMNISQFLIIKINQKYKYVQQLEKFYRTYEIIDDISDILSLIILDKNNTPYDEFNNDSILEPFYTTRHLAGNARFIPSSSKTKYDGSKTEHISLRLDHNTSKKLNYIADFYNYKKSSIIPLLLQDSKDEMADSALAECFCYITDIRNYFYEKHIDDADFEKEYDLLWEILL